MELLKKIISGNPVSYLAIKMWTYAEDKRPLIVFHTILTIFANVLIMLEPLVIGHIFNILQTQGINSQTLESSLWPLTLFIIISLIFWVLHGPSRIIERIKSFHTKAQYKMFLLRGVMSLPASWHTDHHSGDTIDRIEKGAKGLYGFSETNFIFIQDVTVLLVSIVVVLYFNVTAGLVILGAIILNGIIIVIFDRKLIKMYIEISRLENNISEKIYDSISNITTIVILRIEKLLLDVIEKSIYKPLDLYKRSSIINETKWFLVSFINVLAIILSVFFYISQTVNAGGVVLAGTLFILYGYVNRVGEIFYNFAWFYSEKVEQKASVMNSEELVKEFSEKIQRRQTSMKDWKKLQVLGLNFSYHQEEGADLHLSDVLLDIRRGEKIALIGESGGGKTTLLKVIRELYHPQKVEVLLDGKKLPHDFASISSHVSLIPQEPEIFSTTILENITLGVPYPQDEVELFTSLAGFSDVVKRLPKGYQSSVVEKGVNLSGGEKQRLALARGLLASKDKEILLLDEPTSSVDTANELNIFKEIFSRFSSKTILASVHRLHLLSMFDKVYFFRRGKVIASGSFEKLQEESAEFKKLWTKYLKSQKGHAKKQ